MPVLIKSTTETSSLIFKCAFSQDNSIEEECKPINAHITSKGVEPCYFWYDQTLIPIIISLVLTKKERQNQKRKAKEIFNKGNHGQNQKKNNLQLKFNKEPK